MDVIEAVEARRSIREFQNRAVPKETIEKLLALATKAPSGKNRQPWRFVVLQDKRKDELVKVMNKAVSLLKQQNINIGSCEISINAIKEAAAVILVFNGFSNFEKDYRRYTLLMDTQSIGAAVQTLLLAAQNFGLASLWICDIFYCPNEICTWLNRKDELVAAVAIGYPSQSPAPRPRKLLQEVAEWL
jgi:nitroreductase